MKILQVRSGMDDEAHEEALNKTGFWGTRGAGVLAFCSSTSRFLVVRRSGNVEEPLTWGTIGGAIDAHEDPRKAAIREMKEEVGYTGQMRLVPLFIYRSGKFSYHNFLGIVPREFRPHLDFENTAAKWCNWLDFPNPRHFGLVALLQDAETVDVIEDLIGSREERL